MKEKPLILENKFREISKKRLIAEIKIEKIRWKHFLFLNLHIIKRNCIASREIKYYFISRRQALILC